MPNLYIRDEVKHNRFTIGGGSPGGTVSWQVTGTRHDPYIIANPIVVEVEKGPNTLVGKGVYVFPDGYRTSFSSFIPTFSDVSDRLGLTRFIRVFSDLFGAGNQ